MILSSISLGHLSSALCNFSSSVRKFLLMVILFSLINLLMLLYITPIFSLISVILNPSAANFLILSAILGVILFFAPVILQYLLTTSNWTLISFAICSI